MNQQLSQSGGATVTPVTPVTPADEQYSSGAGGHAPFADLDTAIAICPEPFSLDETGLYYAGAKSREPLTLTPIWVQAMLRDTDGNDWSLQIAWRDPEGREKGRVIEMAQLRDSRALIHELTSAGLIVLPRRESDLVTYLMVSTRSDDLPRLLLYRRLGFGSVRVGGVQHLAFMLPGRCLFPRSVTAVSPTYFLPRVQSGAYEAYHAAGTLDDWKTIVAPVRTNVAQVFALCVGLAGPFVAIAGSDNVLYHLYGESSRGKTLALQLFASLWGCGADPQGAASRRCLVERWHSTGNAVELILATHSGVGLAIDELGSGGADTLSVYNYTGGRGKARMTETGGMREQHTWSLLTLSSGEESIADKIEGSLGRKAKTGELIRAMDVFLDDLPHSDSPADEAREQATRLKAQLGEAFGTAGPTFVQNVVDQYQTEEALRRHLASEIDHYQRALIAEATSDGTVLVPAQERALRRFALIAAIGFWAEEFGILPFSDTEIGAAVVAVARAWLKGLPGSSTTERVTEALRDFVIRNQGQLTMEVERNGEVVWDAPPRSCGIAKDGMLLLTEEQFRTACGESGAGRRQALRSLADVGLLRVEEPGRYRYRVSIAELGIHRREFIALWVDKLLTHDQDSGRQPEPLPEPAAT